MDAQTEQVVKQAEEALSKAAQEGDLAKAKQLLEKAAKQLVALGRPPQDVLQKVRAALQALDALKAKTPAKNGGMKDSKIDRQINKAGLPTGGAVPFDPQLERDRKGRAIIKKAPVTYGPKKGKKGYVDKQGRIWIKDRKHGQYPDHWDVQENGGKKGHTRVDPNGNVLP
jgi:hypothetical protein